MQVTSTAIVVHRLQTGVDQEALSVVTHDLRHSESGPSLGPGRVFTSADKMALANVLIDDLSPSIELLNERCLVLGLETMMWSRPAARTTVCVEAEKHTVPLPPLLFLCHRGTLYVKAYKGRGRPKADTPLFASGLPNLYALGAWCSGGNPIPQLPGQRDIARVESMFFESPFTHAGDEPLPHGVESLQDWVAILQKQRSYPASALKSSEMTLGEWMRDVTEGA